ncbi:MarR family transcriptional regulator (plasmid) [Tistrella mobilis]|uniref:MarR family winged helix-turn-helix transcriptional regulator n=1 Tax=Tistrella mobilis TaxID=171437 RepID=UPI003555F544
MTDFDDLTAAPSEQIADALERLAAACRAVARDRDTAAGLAPLQAQLLTLLARRGPSRVGALAHLAGLRQPTVSDALRPLEARGLILRQPLADDGRAIAVSLTAAGATLAAVITRPPAALVDAAATLPSDRAPELLGDLITMIHALQQAGVIAPQRLCVTCAHFRRNAGPDTVRPHFCAMVGAPLGLRHLRVDCPEHLAA